MTPSIAGRLPGADPAPADDPVQDLAEAVARRLLARAGEADPAGPLLLGTKEVARLLGISPASFHRHLAAGAIGPVAVHLGGRRLYSVRELEDWLAARRPSGELPDRRTWLAMQEAAERRGRAVQRSG